SGDHECLEMGKHHRPTYQGVCFMTAIEALTFSLHLSQGILLGTLSDLNDGDLSSRPVSGSNRLCWQLGHLILSERFLLGETGCSYPELPEGFADQHANNPEITTSEAPLAWTVADYTRLLKETRETSIASLGQMNEADLDKPNTGRLAPKAPTYGNLFELAAQHFIMHSGQVSVIRRKLGKPVLF
ncbi:MAG: DinB family protein, partial [Gemmataceae bacterium]